MKMQFLGSGASLNVSNNNYHSNVILTADSKKNLLIDCGTDIRFSLIEQGFTCNDINAIYISHIHADHAGGLEWLGFSNKFESKSVKPLLFITNELTASLWDNYLSGGMNCIENEVASLDTYFEVHSVANNNFNFFDWEGIHFQLIRTLHVKRNKDYLPSFGLMISYNNKNIFITTDTTLNFPFFKEFYEIADLIFHDCELKENKTNVHSNYVDLKQLPSAIKNKIWLYHYQDVKLPDAKADGFLGFVMKGQLYNF